MRIKNKKRYNPKSVQHQVLHTKGFTLIETLIYVAIIGMAVSSFVAFSLSVSSSRSKTYVVQEVQANARVALGIISQKMRAANGVNTATSTFGADPGFISLSVASSTLNPTIIGLNQDNGVLGIKEGLSATTSITSSEVKITNLVFTNLTGSSTRKNIRTEMTVEFNNPSTDITYDYSQSLRTTISIRQ